MHIYSFLFTGVQHRPLLQQGFLHIIMYDPRSVKTVIADAFKGKENTRAYYPSGDGVDKDAVIQ